MATAGGEQQRDNRGANDLFVVEDHGYDRYLVFKINLKYMFASAAAGRMWRIGWWR
jgi:hypothetical protein